MADAHGNIRFDEKIHDWFAMLLREAENDAASMNEMISKLYPNPDHGAADRARRAVAAATRNLRDLRAAMDRLHNDESGKRSPYRPPLRSVADAVAQRAWEDGSGRERGSQTAAWASEQEGRET